MNFFSIIFFTSAAALFYIAAFLWRDLLRRRSTN